MDTIFNADVHVGKWDGPLCYMTFILDWRRYSFYNKRFSSFRAERFIMEPSCATFSATDRGYIFQAEADTGFPGRRI
jgi:hypothetical protein